MREQRGYALFLDMGTGKTRVLAEDLLEPERLPALILVRTSTLGHWASEIVRWTPRIGRVLVFSSKPLVGLPEGVANVWRKNERLRAMLDSSVPVKIVGYDLFKRFRLDHGQMWPFRSVVLDESTQVKNPKSDRTSRVRYACRTARFRRIASGFPAPEGLFDLWSQYDLILPGLLGSSYGAFLREFFLPRENTWGTEWVARIGTFDAIMSRTAPHTIRARREECLDIPPKVYEHRTVDPSPETWRLVSDAMEEWELPAKTLREATDRTLKLLQLPCGFYYDDKRQPQFHQDTAKVDEIADLIQEASGERVVIWTPWIAHQALLVRELRKRVTESVTSGLDDTAVRDWKQTQGAVLVTTFRLQQGVNLAEGKGPSALAIYAARPFKTEERAQSEDRQVRPPQDRAVRIVDVVANTWHDQAYYQLLRDKVGLADAIAQGHLSADHREVEV